MPSDNPYKSLWAGREHWYDKPKSAAAGIGKGGLLGASIGSFIPGGTLPGAAIGAGGGAIFKPLIGPER